MTIHKSFRDYINLIESAQQGVAEGSEIAVDRKTGKVYMPNKELDKLLNQHKAQFQGMTAIEKAQAKKKTPEKQGVAEGSLNEFAPDGFNGGDDGDEFNPRMAKMAYDEGVVKGASLADGATTQRAMAINDWDKHDGGIYSQHFAKGFKAGRLDKINFNNKQYNLNLKLMKDGSIRHGEQGVDEGAETHKYQVVVKGHKRSYSVWVEAKNEDVAIIRAQQYVAREHSDKAKHASVVDMKQGVAEATGNPGMPTPYDQGRADAKKGRPYDNPYDQPGEEQEHRNYRKGYEQGKQQGVAEDQLEETSPDAIEKIEQLVRK